MARRAVTEATESLVQAAQRTTVKSPEITCLLRADYHGGPEILKEIEKKRKELEMAKKQLYKIRQEKRRQK